MREPDDTDRDVAGILGVSPYELAQPCAQDQSRRLFPFWALAILGLALMWPASVASLGARASPPACRPAISNPRGTP